MIAEENLNYDPVEDCYYREIDGTLAVNLAGNYGEIGDEEREILLPNTVNEKYRFEVGRTGGPEEAGVTFMGVRPETADQRVLISMPSEVTL